MRINKEIAVHPLFIGAFPVISLYSENARMIPLGETALPLAVTELFVLALWGVLYAVVRDIRRSGLIASLGVMLFFAYGHVYDITGIGNLFLFPLWVMLFVSGKTVIVRRKSWNLKSLTVLINALSIILVAVPSATAAYKLMSRDSYALSPPSVTGTAGDLPDIYYIIMDGYARSDVMKEIYGYDNSDFIEYLEEKGFYVAAESRSNYPITYLSLASSMNFTYLDGLSERVGEKSDNLMPLYEMIHESRAAEFLRRQGYRFVVFSSGCSFTDIKDADVYMAPRWYLTEFQTAVMNITPLPWIMNVFPDTSQYTLHRDNILYALENVGRVPGHDSPKFVFCHIVAPHFPFVFREDGGQVDHDGKLVLKSETGGVPGADGYYVNGYRAQAVYLTGRLKQAVGEILANSKRPPIIIVQSDHGPDAMLDWSSMEKTNLNEKMSILNAYYLPDNGREMLYPGITPVNTFRLLFNRYFETGLEILEDESYFTVAPYEYRFYNVTDRLSVSGGRETDQ